MTAQCAVRGCTQEATTIVRPYLHRSEIDDANDVRGGFEWATCQFHERAIVAGDSFAFEGENDEVILMGTDLPPRLLNYMVSRDGIADPMLTLVLGRDRIESSRVTVQISDEMAKALFPSAEGNVLAVEVERNRAD